MSSHINSFNPPDSIDIVLSEDLDGPILAEYTWAIKQIHSSHGEVKKWILYAGQQLEMADYIDSIKLVKSATFVPQYFVTTTGNIYNENSPV
jgi:hypothetical protein